MHGIHHPRFKTGLRQRDRSRPTLKLRNILTGVVPEHSVAVDYMKTVADPGLYDNDIHGTCGPVSVANARKLISKNLTGVEQSPTQADVWDLYRRSGNPNFNPTTDVDDNGVDMSVMLSAVVKGGIGGVKALAFAEVDLSNEEEIKAAEAIFGCVLLGVTLQVAQQGQTDAGGPWDFVAGSDVWGGHAITSGAYSAAAKDTLDVWSWGMRLSLTEAFVTNVVRSPVDGQCFVVIWPENIGTKQFQQGVDLAKLAAAYEALTGRPFPNVSPPQPIPSPTPVPVGFVATWFVLQGATMSLWGDPANPNSGFVSEGAANTWAAKRWPNGGFTLIKLSKSA